MVNATGNVYGTSPFGSIFKRRLLTSIYLKSAKYFFLQENSVFTVMKRTLKIAKTVPIASNAFERPTAFNRPRKLLFNNGILISLNEKSFVVLGFFHFLLVLILDLNPIIALFGNIDQDLLYYVHVLIPLISK